MKDTTKNTFMSIDEYMIMAHNKNYSDYLYDLGKTCTDCFGFLNSSYEPMVKQIIQDYIAYCKHNDLSYKKPPIKFVARAN